MFIEVINKKFDVTYNEDSEKNIYTIEWKDIIKKNSDKHIISEVIFFKGNINITYKKNSKKREVIFLGEYDNKFWFFKILKKINKEIIFEIKKPILDEVTSIKIFIIDWYNILNDIKIDDFSIEFAIAKRKK